MLMRDFTELKAVMTEVGLPKYKPVLYMDKLGIWFFIRKFRDEKSESYEYDSITKSWIFTKPLASWMEPDKDRDRTPGDFLLHFDLQSVIYDFFKPSILRSQFQEDLAANLEILVRCVHSKVFLDFAKELLIKYIYANEEQEDLDCSAILDNIENDLNNFNNKISHNS
jgi:hypothetical protein